MSSRAQHFRWAENLLHDAEKIFDPDKLDNEHDSLVATAQAHATLASIPNEVYNEYLDLCSLEHAREEVVSTPGALSRDWLVEDEPRCPHCNVVGGGHTFECIANQ